MPNSYPKPNQLNPITGPQGRVVPGIRSSELNLPGPWTAQGPRPSPVTNPRGDPGHFGVWRSNDGRRRGELRPAQPGENWGRSSVWDPNTGQNWGPWSAGPAKGDKYS